MNSWFDTEAKIERLHDAVALWVGTPFRANSNVPGPDGGVSCQKLVAEIYRACGCCDVNVPEVAMAHARFSRESLVERFMEKRTEFELVWPPSVGDLLGFRIGRVIHHLGIYLLNGRFVHAMDHIGTVVSDLSDGTWGSRLAAVWRPKPRLK